MSPIEVGFLGGPHDGRCQDFPVVANGLPSQHLIVAELDTDISRWLTDEPDVTGSVVPAFRQVRYRLAVNPADSGPMLVYVHPDVADLSRG